MARDNAREGRLSAHGVSARVDVDAAENVVITLAGLPDTDRLLDLFDRPGAGKTYRDGLDEGEAAGHSHGYDLGVQETRRAVIVDLLNYRKTGGDAGCVARLLEMAKANDIPDPSVPRPPIPITSSTSAP